MVCYNAFVLLYDINEHITHSLTDALDERSPSILIVACDDLKGLYLLPGTAAFTGFWPAHHHFDPVDILQPLTHGAAQHLSTYE